MNPHDKVLKESDRVSDFMIQTPNLKTRITNFFNSVRHKYLSQYIDMLRRGNKIILLSPKIARGGNWLYFWAQAAALRHHGKDKASLLYGPGMDAWIEEFPRLNAITARDADYGFFTRRSGYFPSDIETDIGEEDLHYFVREYILPSERFSKRLEQAEDFIDEKTLVINVRRGDYYSVPLIKKEFGLDTTTYVHEAVKHLQTIINPSKIIFVSDDLKWCRENLSQLSSIAPCSFEKMGPSMFDDLALIAHAPYLILTNTTFGYWGAYIGELLDQKVVLSPGIHQDIPVGAPSYQERPHMHRVRWISVEHPERKNWISGEPL
ncbi:alpha-1,2-fucosyltransferase [Rothia mucilaginosa]|uniref:alpha-1,2-fucosyltransferase n=1 Tax=Rothia mucilaginosa TaxID=43675 RepID=UPI0026E9A04E|nr:alpha-1,2-fucosyltransferase [Rothia mucilaginosa]